MVTILKRQLYTVKRTVTEAKPIKLFRDSVVGANRLAN